MNRVVRQNFAEKSAACVRWLPEGKVVENGRFTLIDSGLGSDTYNVVVARDLSDPATLLNEGVGYFMARQQPMALWYWEDESDRAHMGDLLAYGLVHAETDVVMVGALATMRPEATLPPHVSIAQVQTPAALQQFAELIVDQFGATAEGTVVARYYRQFKSYAPRDHPTLRHYLGWVDGHAVASGTLFSGSETAGIYDIITRPDYRQRGLGSAMVAHLLREATALSYRHAVLQASAAGANLYRRAGFAAVGTVHIFENRSLLQEA
jgi:ribosomal protein S18 acetylase RimI-like enzyme